MAKLKHVIALLSVGITLMISHKSRQKTCHSISTCIVHACGLNLEQADTPSAATSSLLEICSSESQQETGGTGSLHLYSNTASGMQIQKIYMS